MSKPKFKLILLKKSGKIELGDVQFSVLAICYRTKYETANMTGRVLFSLDIMRLLGYNINIVKNKTCRPDVERQHICN